MSRHGEGYPIPGLDEGGVPHPKSGQGGTLGYPRPSQVWMVGGTWGTPWPGLDGGYPIPGLDGGIPRVPCWPGLDGEYLIPGQVWMVLRGATQETPSKVWTGGVPWGTHPPARFGWWRVPRVPPGQVWMGGTPS